MLISSACIELYAFTPEVYILTPVTSNVKTIWENSVAVRQLFNNMSMNNLLDSFAL